MNTPPVSVVIPCYNSEKYIEECIDSVLSQTYNNIEIVIVDDCSTDSSHGIVKSKYASENLLLIRNDINSGVNISRHTGVVASHGDYICFLDSDDLFCPEKVERQVRLLEDDQSTVLCHTGADFIGAYNDKILPAFNDLGVSRKYDLRREKYFLKSNYICASTVMFRKKALAEINFKKKQLFQYEDFVLWTILAGKGLYAFLEDRLIRYRCHPESATYKVHKSELVKHYSYLEYCLTCYSYRELGMLARVKLVRRILFALKNIVKTY